jgi:hypothetical protein
MRIILAAVAACAALVACSSSSAAPSDQVGRHEVKKFVCPSGKAMSAALGRAAPAPKQSRFETQTAFCSYVDAVSGTDADLMVSVTFGTAASGLPVLVKAAYPGRTGTTVHGVGAGALFLPAKGSDGATLVFQNRDATFSLIGARMDTKPTLVKVARVLIGS